MCLQIHNPPQQARTIISQHSLYHLYLTPTSSKIHSVYMNTCLLIFGNTTLLIP